MMMTTLKKKRLIVLGNFFSCDGEIGNPLRVAYMGNEISPWLKEAFETNTQIENYEELSKHPDPQVRCLVARNLECLEMLANDGDHRVRQIARESLRYMHNPKMGNGIPARDYMNQWVTQ